MNKISQQGDNLVVQMTFEEWAVLSTLLRYREGETRTPGVLSHGGAGTTFEEAQACLAESLQQAWLSDEKMARTLLADSARCVVSENEATLHLTVADADTLLRVVNGKRLTAWESLGRPSLQGGIRLPDDPVAVQSYMLLAAADHLMDDLLSLVR